MNTLQYIQLGNALMFYLHGREVELYLYSMKWFEKHPMHFKNQPIIYN